MRDQCGFLADGKTPKTRCQHPATHRNESVGRCHLHGGHHDYTEEWDGERWIAIPADCSLWWERQDTGPYSVHSVGEAGVVRVEFEGFHYPYQAREIAEEMQAASGLRVVFAVNTDDPESSVAAEDEAYCVPAPNGWECPYCGKRPTGFPDPSVIACCHEVGHCNPVCPHCDSGSTILMRGRFWKCGECHGELEAA